MFVVLELLDQPLDLVLACCILLLDCRKRYSRYYVIHGVVTSFPVTASWLCRSCWPNCEFNFSTTRVTLGVKRTFWQTSSCVFIHTAFSMQAACSVLYRTTACDRVWWTCKPFSWASFKLHQNTVFWRTFPSILVWCDPWFRQIAWSFLHTMLIIDRIHCMKNTACLPLLRLFPPGIISPFLNKD